MIDYEAYHKQLQGVFNRNNRTSLITLINILYRSPEFWKDRRIEGLRLRAFESFLHYWLYPTPWGMGGSEMHLIGTLLSEGDERNMILLKDIYRTAPDIFEDMNGDSPYRVKYRQLVESLSHERATFTLKPTSHEQ